MFKTANSISLNLSRNWILMQCFEGFKKENTVFNLCFENSIYSYNVFSSVCPLTPFSPSWNALQYVPFLIPCDLLYLFLFFFLKMHLAQELPISKWIQCHPLEMGILWVATSSRRHHLPLSTQLRMTPHVPL